jgi:hypothetical protein
VSEEPIAHATAATLSPHRPTPAEGLDLASTELSSSLDQRRCMAIAARIAARHLADAATLVAPTSGGSLLVVSADAYGAVEFRRVDTPADAVPGLGEAIRGYPPVPSRWLDPTTVPGWLLPTGFTDPPGAVVVTPLPGHGLPVGALVLLRRDVAVGDDDTLVRTFATQAGAALSVARRHTEQSVLTRTLLDELRPPTLRSVHGVELAGGYRAGDADRGVGGDFYDVYPAAAPDTETLLVLGDVCGRGLPAAILTGRIRTFMHALAPLAEDHGGVLGRLNDLLLTEDNSRMATMVMASVSHGADVRLRLSCAGHPAPLLLRADGSVERPDTRGTILGALPQFRVRTAQDRLAPGDACILFSDGLSEARRPRDGEPFGVDRLARAASECGGMPAEAIVERLMMLAAEWSDDHHDDLAVVVIAVPPAERSGRYSTR